MMPDQMTAIKKIKKIENQHKKISGVSMGIA